MPKQRPQDSPESFPVAPPSRFEGPRHRRSVLALAEAALGLSQKDKELFTDKKTGLPNRRAFERDFAELLNEVRPGDVSIIFFDLNKLKRVNDTVGWHAGDKYKLVAGDTITEEMGIRPYDKIYILEGDEYCVTLDHRYDDGEANLEEITQRVQAKVVDNIYGHDEFANTTGLGVSAGWDTLTEGDTLQSLLERAHDKMMVQKGELYARPEEAIDIQRDLRR
jgi:diguanylate cyclase (GGDEF)-like protein